MWREAGVPRYSWKIKLISVNRCVLDSSFSLHFCWLARNDASNWYWWTTKCFSCGYLEAHLFSWDQSFCWNFIAGHKAASCLHHIYYWTIEGCSFNILYCELVTDRGVAAAALGGICWLTLHHRVCHRASPHLERAQMGLMASIYFITGTLKAAFWGDLSLFLDL